MHKWQMDPQIQMKNFKNTVKYLITFNSKFSYVEIFLIVGVKEESSRVLFVKLGECVVARLEKQTELF